MTTLRDFHFSNVGTHFLLFFSYAPFLNSSPHICMVIRFRNQITNSCLTSAGSDSLLNSLKAAYPEINFNLTAPVSPWRLFSLEITFSKSRGAAPLFRQVAKSRSLAHSFLSASIFLSFCCTQFCKCYINQNDNKKKKYVPLKWLQFFSCLSDLSQSRN